MAKKHHSFSKEYLDRVKQMLQHSLLIPAIGINASTGKVAKLYRELPSTQPYSRRTSYPLSENRTDNRT